MSLERAERFDIEIEQMLRRIPSANIMRRNSLIEHKVKSMVVKTIAKDDYHTQLLILEAFELAEHIRSAVLASNLYSGEMVFEEGGEDSDPRDNSMMPEGDK